MIHFTNFTVAQVMTLRVFSDKDMYVRFAKILKILDGCTDSMCENYDHHLS